MKQTEHEIILIYKDKTQETITLKFYGEYELPTMIPRKDGNFIAALGNETRDIPRYLEG